MFALDVWIFDRRKRSPVRRSRYSEKAAWKISILQLHVAATETGTKGAFLPRTENGTTGTGLRLQQLISHHKGMVNPARSIRGYTQAEALNHPERAPLARLRNGPAEGRIDD